MCLWGAREWEKNFVAPTHPQLFTNWIYFFVFNSSTCFQEKKKTKIEEEKNSTQRSNNNKKKPSSLRSSSFCFGTFPFLVFGRSVGRVSVGGVSRADDLWPLFGDECIWECYKHKKNCFLRLIFRTYTNTVTMCTVWQWKFLSQTFRFMYPVRKKSSTLKVTNFFFLFFFSPFSRTPQNGNSHERETSVTSSLSLR